MLAQIKRQWGVLQRGTPGRRFQARYQTAHRKKSRRVDLGWRVGRITLSAVTFVIGVVLVFIPGPAIVFFALSGMLLASDSLFIARTLDWCEIRGRKIYAAARRRWVRLPLGGRVVLAVLGALLSAASTYLTYRVLH